MLIHLLSKIDEGAAVQAVQAALGTNHLTRARIEAGHAIPAVILCTSWIQVNVEANLL